jgi:hypothetical protein
MLRQWEGGDIHLVRVHADLYSSHSHDNGEQGYWSSTTTKLMREFDSNIQPRRSDDASSATFFFSPRNGATSAVMPVSGWRRMLDFCAFQPL